MKRKAALRLANTIVVGCSLVYAVATYYLHRYHKDSSKVLLLDLELETIERIPIQGKKNTTTTELPPPQSQRKVEENQEHLDTPRRKKFWRYDDAGPKIKRATTHFLPSIPQKHRLGIPQSEKDIITEQQIQQFYIGTIQNSYASNPDNVYPNKLHLYEINPSITKLPDHYRENEDWRSVFGTDRLPYYVASYRVTHLHNCYDDDTTVKLMGDNWKHISRLKTDYLGISLMDKDLDILVDTTLNLNNITGIFHDYEDYRLFNLGEQLYLTTYMEIVPIDLSLTTTNNDITSTTVRRLTRGLGPDIPFSFKEIPPVFPSEGASSLRVWARNFPSCALNSHKYSRKKSSKQVARSRGKNFLYFGRNTTNDTDTTTVIRYLKYNPIDASTVDLTRKCDRRRRSNAPMYNEIAGPVQPKPAFETLDASKYSHKSWNELFNDDRGSACCTSVKAKSIFPISLHDTTQNTTIGESDLGIHEDDEILVGIVHPKTKFPGKGLPKGITPNTYLSRFVAFLPREPYTIVAKSGMFCLGYPSRSLDGNTKSENPMEFVQMNRLIFANKFYECPRIHFVTGMVDTPSTNDTSKNESDSVIIAYGVSDCLSRFVEIPKSEIIRMLTPDGGSISYARYTMGD